MLYKALQDSFLVAFFISYAKIDNIHHQRQKETSNKEYLTFG